MFVACVQSLSPCIFVILRSSIFCLVCYNCKSSDCWMWSVSSPFVFICVHMYTIVSADVHSTCLLIFVSDHEPHLRVWMECCSVLQCAAASCGVAVRYSKLRCIVVWVVWIGMCLGPEEARSQEKEREEAGECERARDSGSERERVGQKAGMGGGR